MDSGSGAGMTEKCEDVCRLGAGTTEGEYGITFWGYHQRGGAGVRISAPWEVMRMLSS